MTNVTASLKSNTAVDIRARRFLWRSDEPKPVGGADSGPTPYEFLLGSLAACTAMTLRLHANNTNIPLSGVDITLEYDREHAEDSAEDFDSAAELFATACVIYQSGHVALASGRHVDCSNAPLAAKTFCAMGVRATMLSLGWSRLPR